MLDLITFYGIYRFVNNIVIFVWLNSNKKCVCALWNCLIYIVFKLWNYVCMNKCYKLTFGIGLKVF